MVKVETNMESEDIKVYICVECGRIMEDYSSWTEPHGEDMCGCSYCGGEVEEAKVYLLKAHEVAPKDYIVAGNLAYLAFNEGDYDTSLKYIEILTSCDDPKYVELGNNLLEKINSKRL